MGRKEGEEIAEKKGTVAGRFNATCPAVRPTRHIYCSALRGLLECSIKSGCVQSGAVPVRGVELLAACGRNLLLRRCSMS